MIIDKAGVKREECVMVGDSCVDMQTAHNARITSIRRKLGIPPPALKLEENHADYIADTAAQLLQIIESLYSHDATIQQKTFGPA